MHVTCKDAIVILAGDCNVMLNTDAFYSYDDYVLHKLVVFATHDKVSVNHPEEFECTASNSLLLSTCFETS